jgi:hypothetical protein
VGKLLVSTPLGAEWLPYCGLPTYQGQSTWSTDFDVENVEIRPETTFKDIAYCATGLVATTTDGALWANSWYHYDFLGVYWATIGATNGRGDTLYQVAPPGSGYDKCFAWGEPLNGVWVTKTDGTLHYSGEYFWGCGLPDEPAYNTGAFNINQVGTATTWSNLKHISGSDSYWRSFFTFNDGQVMAAGDNADGSLGDTYGNNDAAFVTYPIPFVSTPQAVELGCDAWHSGSYFRTAANEMYIIVWNWTNGVTEYTLIDTGVTRIFGGSQNWFICYEKTDGAIYRCPVSTPPQPPIQVHPGPAFNVWVDPWWGIISIIKPDGVVDVFEDEGIPLYENIFPGQVVVKTVSVRRLVVGLTGELTAHYTNDVSPIVSSTPTLYTLMHAPGYALSAGEIRTPHIALLPSGEIIINQGEIE